MHPPCLFFSHNPSHTLLTFTKRKEKSIHNFVNLSIHFTLEFVFTCEWITKESKLPEHRRIKCIIEDVYIFQLGLADQQYSILIVLAE